jgi:hypothetical protein
MYCNPIGNLDLKGEHFKTGNFLEKLSFQKHDHEGEMHTSCANHVSPPSPQTLTYGTKVEVP